jgi:hypothetical protein
MSRNLIAGAAVLLATLLGQDLGRAQDPVAVPDDAIHVAGTACRPRKSDVSKTNYNNTSIVNESSSSAKVACPVHLQENGFFLTPNDMEIFAFDRSSSSNITCTLFAFDGASPGTIFQEPAVSSGTKDPVTGKSLQMLRGIDGAIELSGFQGLHMFSLTCTLPGASDSSPRSEIVDYRIGLF